MTTPLNSDGSVLLDALARVGMARSFPTKSGKASPPPSVATLETASLSTFTTESVSAPLVIKPVPAPKKCDEDDLELLRPHTTMIRGYDSLVRKCYVKFIPVLEARGGTDKDSTGHRRDSIPIANGIADSPEDTCSAIYLYQDDEFGTNEQAKRTNEILRRHLLQTCAGLVVRCNPGTLPPAAQATLDVMLTELSSAGITVMSTPEVMRRMGAKDALVKIRHLRCGMEDTSVYYDGPSFVDGFLRSIAFRPRVIKQNRGSQGEGIWIVKLRDETMYCEIYGDRVVSMDTELVLVEANDNHVEHHTVAEFIEFCIHGRTELSGHWESKGVGRYLEGGPEAGAMLVDQRFLPRIVEGEVRCTMVGPHLVSLVHKVPAPGGYSATLQSGANYTQYTPGDPKFARLVENFQEDLPKIRNAFGITDQPLPLLWTADFIFGEPVDGEETFYVGEFNCSCVGITQQLNLAPLVGETAAESVAKR